ncbi:MAG: translocation/assembly module TamB domain-containing protein [Deltaproteobacteria bacterium]|nr:translocation/assembly module TamB domain-containing protein [Deltaproteobacteria bacterium]
MQRRTHFSQRVRVAFVALSTTALVLVAGLVVARAHPLERWLSFLVVEGLEALTGERAAVGRVVVKPTRRTLSVEGLALLSRQTGEPVLAVREASVKVGLAGVLPGIEEIHVVEPVASLHLDVGGLREFRSVSGHEGGGTRSTPWRHLRVTDGRLDLAWPDGRIQVEDLDVVPLETPHACDVSVARLDVASGPIAQAARDVRLEGITLDLAHLVVPEVAVRFPQIALSGDLALSSGQPPRGTVEAVLDLAGLTPALSPGTRLEGQIRARARVSGSNGSVEVDGTVATGPVALWQAKANGQEVPIRFGALEARWRLGPEGVVEVPSWRGSWAEGTLEGHARWQPGSGGLALGLKTRGVHLEPLFRDLSVARAPWVDLGVDLDAEIAGSVAPFMLAGSFRADTEGFEVHSGPARAPGSEPILAIRRGRLEGALALDGRAIGIGLDRLALTHGSVARGSVSVGFSAQGPLTVDLAFRPANLADFGPLGGLALGGTGPLDAHLAGPFSAPVIGGEGVFRDLWVFGVPFADEIALRVESPVIEDLQFPGFEARKGQTRYGGNLAVDFRTPLSIETQVLVRDGRISDLAGMFLDLPGVEGRLDGTLELSGPPYQLDGGAELDLHDVDIVGETFPSGHASARMDAGRFTLSSLLLTRAGGRESLLARGTVGQAYAANFEVLSDGLSLETLDALQGADWKVEGPLQVMARWQGTLTEPLFSGRVALGRTRMPGGEVPGSVVTFDTEGSRIQGRARLVGEAVRATAWIDWDTVDWGVEGRFRELPVHPAWPMQGGGQPLEGWLGGSIALRGHAADPPDIEATAESVRIRWGDQVYAATTPWRFDRRGPAWSLGGLSLSGQDTEVRADIERRADGQLAGAAEGRVDLAWLSLLGSWVGRAAGRADVRASVGGTLAQPDVRVDVDLRDVLFRSPYFPSALEGGRGRITVTPEAVTLESDLTGRLGGGSLRASGWMGLEDWHPVNADFRAEIRDARVRYVEELPPMVADADLTFSGPVDGLVLGGDVRIREMLFTERIDWETWILELGERRLLATAPEEVDRYFSMDLGIVANGTGRIRNNVGDASLSADLRVVGDTGRPGLVGQVRVDPGGMVLLKERAFDVARGEISFLDPWAFDPQLDFLLEADIQSRLREYHVSYRIDGPFSAWRASAWADPALSQADVNFLLLFGATREELEGYGGLEGALAWEGMDLLGREIGEESGSIQRIGTWIRQTVPFDRVEVVTGPSMRGSRTVSSEPRLLVEWDLNQRDLTASGEFNLVQFGDRYLSIEKRLAQRFYVTGYWAGVQEDRSLPIGGAWGTEFKFRWEIE